MLVTDKQYKIKGIQHPFSATASDFISTLRQKVSSLGTAAFVFLVLSLLLEGWQLRDDKLITAESGVGYALGITGGVMMILLLIYPLRKRVRSLRVLGPVKHWFRFHMLMGILGPTLILFHSNFHLGALNSNVALVCMLTVASSGLLGRYFYAKIHYGLYGSQATLHELQQGSNWNLNRLTNELSYLPRLKEQLQAYEVAAVKAGQGLLSIIAIPWLAVTTQMAYWRLWQQCKHAIRAEITDPTLRRRQMKQTRSNLRSYFAAARKVAEFGFYVRLFSLWHVLHLPLFIMMLITGIVHVITAHMY